MKPISLSLITITKDDKAGLGRTLASAAGLRAAGVEHQVIDGGRDTEATQRVVAQNSGAIRLQMRSPRGIADAFNAGVAEARGEWIWFLNGGDAVHESMDAGWLLALLAKSQARIIVGGIHYDGDVSPRFAPSLAKQWPLLNCWLPHPASLVRREALVRAGGFDERFVIAADYALWFRLLEGEVAPDMISIPFARFKMGGISQREDSRQSARGEEARVLLSQGGHLLYQGLRPLGRVLYRLLWAIRHR